MKTDDFIIKKATNECCKSDYIIPLKLRDYVLTDNLEHLLDAEARNNDIIIAGGCIRDIMHYRSSIDNDIDIFVLNSDLAYIDYLSNRIVESRKQDLIRYYRQKYSTDDCKEILEQRIKEVNNNKPLDDEYPYTEFITIKKNKNVINISTCKDKKIDKMYKIQIVYIRKIKTVLELLNTFDFTCNMVAFDINNYNFIYYKDSLDDINDKKLRYNNDCPNAISCLNRAFKFITTKDYTLSQKEMARMLRCIQMEMPLINIDNFSDDDILVNTNMSNGGDFFYYA